MKDIKDKLARIGELIAGWEATEGASELERDMALGLLREIYDEVKFGRPTAEAPEAAEAAEAAEMIETVEYPEPEPSAAEAAARDGDSPPCEGGVPSAEAEGEVVAPEPEPEQEPQPEQEPAPEPTREPDPTPEAIRIAARRVAPEVIRSLYGSENDSDDKSYHKPVDKAEAIRSAMSALQAIREPEPEPEPAPEPEPEPEFAQDEVSASPTPSAAEAEISTTPSAAEAAVREGNSPPCEGGVPSASAEGEVVADEASPTPESRTTLADAMAAGHRTLGETLRGGAPSGNVASHIAAAERSNLRRSIGLNDRFLMIRDMFNGDATAFDSAIARLDTFTDLDEAVIWMRDNYDWNAESKGVTLLIGLLERKLGA